MSYVELYSKDILDLANFSQIASDFNESNGDYIKVEVFREDSDIVLNTLFSNRLLLMYPEVDDYYIGPYHYHPENPNMEFCTGKEHTDTSITNLRPVPINDNNTNEKNSTHNHKKNKPKNQKPPQKPPQKSTKSAMKKMNTVLKEESESEDFSDSDLDEELTSELNELKNNNLKRNDNEEKDDE